ncbi:MAG TPA: universal stress protein [Arthrobacter sp.]|nr:universal stress protein [Arthrobacter sp.]
MTETPAAEGRIVVGVDGSPASILALRWAARLVPELGTSIAAVTAWQTQIAVGTFVPVEWEPEKWAEQIVADAVTEAFGDKEPCQVQTLTRRGQAARVLIDESATAALVVVGSRGHGGFAGLLLGSVSSAVAEHAHCAVLIARGDGEPADQPAT